MSQAMNVKVSLQVIFYQWLHSNHSVLDSSQLVVLSSTKCHNLNRIRWKTTTYATFIFFLLMSLINIFFVWKGGLNMVGKNNLSCMWPQTCSLSCTQQWVPNLTRVETGSVNKTNNMMKLYPQILPGIPHNSTFANGNTNREGILNSTSTTLPSNTNSTAVRALSSSRRASSLIVFNQFSTLCIFL